MTNLHTFLRDPSQTLQFALYARGTEKTDAKKGRVVVILFGGFYSRQEKVLTQNPCFGEIQTQTLILGSQRHFVESTFSYFWERC